MKKGNDDAMVATELAFVAYPFAGNIGGGFMVYRKANEEIFLIIEKKRH
jgi:gamma-glutamyltranspeptidase